MNPLVANPYFLTVKAALAAGLATLGCHLLGIPDLLSAAFVALLSVSPTLTSGLRRSGEQLVGAVGAGVLAAVCTLLPLPVPLQVSLALLVSVGGAFLLGLGRAYTVAGFSALYVVLIPGHQAFMTVEIRVAAVVLGALASLVVNAVVTAPFYPAVFGRRLSNVERLASQALQHASSSGEGAALSSVEAAAQHLSLELVDALAEARWHPGVPTALLQKTQQRVTQLSTALLRVRAAALVDVAYVQKTARDVLEELGQPPP